MVDREKYDIMIGRLILAVLVVATALSLYGIWLLWPKDFPIMLLGVSGILVSGWLMDAAKSKKEKRYQERSRLTAGEKRRCFCTSLN